MYIPTQFEETRPEVLTNFIRHHPLGAIVVQDAGGLCADHIPLLPRSLPSSGMELVGHVAKANRLWRKAVGGISCLVLFQGSNAYISPGWYSTKSADGRVVPTWNYEVVHVEGLLTAVEEDPVWMRNLLRDLTAEQEKQASGEKPWTMEEAPADYIEGLVRSVVGIRIEVRKMSGKFKLSQNQPEANQQSVIEALRARSDLELQAMAKAIENHRKSG